MDEGIALRAVGPDSLLARLSGPGDLKELSDSELTQLAEEIRTAIIATTAVTGGHLGPSLGVVELTIALHHIMASPVDRIVFDTGHQAYPHKLLTGRLAR
ncbi:MAG: 1-deoxy-D-xylulose-5-phosphate synthase N-terminal domain-containing protein, partial [Candidatus Limnocylindrus sp.]